MTTHAPTPTLDLAARGVTVPERIDGAGRCSGGGLFAREHLYKLLANPVYAGRLRHRGQEYPGQRPAIVDAATSAAVQAGLVANHHPHRRERGGGLHLLAGRLQDAGGALLMASHAQKGGVRYRHYVGREAGPGGRRLRLPAGPIEAAVVQALGATSATDANVDAELPGTAMPDATPWSAGHQDPGVLAAADLVSVTVHPDRLVLQRTGEQPSLEVPYAHHPQQRRRAILVPPGREGAGLRAMKAEDRARPLTAIARSRVWMGELIAARIASSEAIAVREGLSALAVRMTLSLARLSPRIVRAILEGRLPRGIGQRDLSDPPASWAEQERRLGLGPAQASPSFGPARRIAASHR